MLTLHSLSRIARYSAPFARRYATKATEASTTAAASTTATEAAEVEGTAQSSAEVVRPRFRQPKNLREVAAYLPENGLGAKFTRNLWIRNGYEDSYWTITCINPSPNGKRLNYYGRLTWRGTPSDQERRVRTANKRGWRFIRE